MAICGEACGPCPLSTDKRARSVPVDKGWSWVVVAAACVTFGLPAGSARVTGIIYLEMIDRYGSDRQLTFWVFSLRSLVTLLLGPLASLIMQRVSHRIAITIAAVLAVTSTVATGFAPFMEFTFLTYGVVYGFAVALTHVASLTCTSAYFDRHRGLAVGLTTAGGGVMAFVLPQLARELFDNYSFEGALLVYSGVFLHLFVCALLIRPIASYPLASTRTNVESKRGTEKCGSCNAATPQATATAAAAPAEMTRTAFNIRPSLTRQTSLPLGASVDVAMADLGISSTLYLPAPEEDDVGDVEKPQCEQQQAVVKTPSTKKNEIVTDRNKRFSLGLLKNERMWIICLITVLAGNAFLIVFTALPPYGENVGVPRQQTSTLLAIGGATEVVCRALHGWLSDRKYIPPLLQLGICSGLMSLVTFLCPTLGGELSVGLMAVACGVVGTSIFTLTTVCTRDLLGEENMTSAVGIQMAAQTISAIVSTSTMGYLTEMTGRWNEVFYFMGSNLVAVTLLSIGYCVRLKYIRLQKMKDQPR